MNALVSSLSSNAFDIAAGAYDDFETLPGTERLRAIIYRVLDHYFHSGQRILELNCGTGTDAVHLARRGVQVHATDASVAMVRATEKKVRRERVADFVTTQLVRLERLYEVTGMPYDGVFSNLGGLNCIPQPGKLRSSLTCLVRPAGHVILVVMPTFSLWESMSFLVRGKIRHAFRRMRPAMANFNGMHVRTFYHSVGSIVKAFAPEFVHVRTLGLNILTPPPTSVNARRHLGKAIALLEIVETICAPLYPFNRAGDHVLLVLRRRDHHGEPL